MADHTLTDNDVTTIQSSVRAALTELVEVAPLDKSGKKQSTKGIRGLQRVLAMCDSLYQTAEPDPLTPEEEIAELEQKVEDYEVWLKENPSTSLKNKKSVRTAIERMSARLIELKGTDTAKVVDGKPAAEPAF